MAETKMERKAPRRERWSWYFYDFGNSAYAAVILLAVYSAYFKGAVVGGQEGTRLWGIAVGIAMLVTAVTAPVLGTIADFAGTRKRILFIYTSIACVFTAMLVFVGPGDVFTGVLFFIIAEIAYRSAQVFYNSLLPDIAHLDEMGHVSGNGWAIGSVGGIVCLLIVLAAIQLIPAEVLDPNLVVRLSFLFTGLFFAVSSIWLFLYLKERTEPQKLPEGENYLSVALKRMGKTFRSVKDYKDFLKFMVAFLIYNDGILMTLNFAAIIGAVLYGLTQTQLIIFMVIVQVTSVGGAWLMGKLATRYGAKKPLLISLIGMTLTVAGIYLVKDVNGFFVIGALAGLSLTGVQSVSRTMVGQLAPEGKSGEFYGFFAVAGRTSSFIGPTIFGLVAAWATNVFLRQGFEQLAAEQKGILMAMITIIVFLIVGTVIFFVWVKDPLREGIREEKAAARAARKG
ncbi:MAG: MFS transporter [Anaerolineaceae bacterium]|nr:MFS transporter [Anaerolineaceae bacterium]